MKTIMVVSSHTDDEALGCGSTIAKLVAQGEPGSLIIYDKWRRFSQRKIKTLIKD